ncbi:MAG: 2Fe-2S ferredoxin [Cryomorphaceae bacterium]|jgi:2Fe-2S ferredoxin
MNFMIKVSDSNGESKQVEFQPGSSLMEVLRDAGYEEILAMCGGCCSCATCHIHIEPSPKVELLPIEEDEEMLLEMADGYSPEKSRLSCQIELTSAHEGMHVTLIEPE